MYCKSCGAPVQDYDYRYSYCLTIYSIDNINKDNVNKITTNNLQYIIQKRYEFGFLDYRKVYLNKDS